MLNLDASAPDRPAEPASESQADNPFAGSTASPFSDPFPAAPIPPAVAADAPEGSYEYALVQTAPSVPADEVETSTDAVDVRIYWGRSLLTYAHLAPPRAFYVGEEESKNLRCDYFLPAEKLGATRAPLVVASGGAVRVVLLPGARGVIEQPGAEPKTLADAERLGLAVPCVELAGALEMTLAPGMAIRMQVGDLTFEVGSVRAGKKAVASLAAAAVATGTLSYIGASFAGHVGLLVAMAMVMPPLGATGSEAPTEQQRYFIQQHLDSTAEVEPEARETDMLAEQNADDQEGGTGTASVGESGSLGSPTSQAQGNRFAVAGPEDNANPQLARLAALQAAQDFGMVGLLNAGVGGDPNAPIAPWGGLESIGNDPLSARGNMWGNSVGDSFGAGGLGLSGIGEGGGGRGEGIGLGTVGTIGHGAGTGTGQGFGSHNGRLSRGHRTTAPQVRIGVTGVNGRLPPEVIQRIVRQNFGRFRLCYETGLRQSPNLQGRVVVRFVIGHDGRVSNVGGGGDLPNGGVISCVVGAFYGLSFPPPDGGIVTVSYPILFSPGG